MLDSENHLGANREVRGGNTDLSGVAHRFPTSNEEHQLLVVDGMTGRN
jgi:hypothetical protein